MIKKRFNTTGVCVKRKHYMVDAGVHDVKSLKLKLREGDEAKYNSPWNIAVDFNINMSLSSKEIETMLIDYSKDNNLSMDIEMISSEIHFFTNGYHS